MIYQFWVGREIRSWTSIEADQGYGRYKDSFINVRKKRRERSNNMVRMTTITPRHKARSVEVSDPVLCAVEPVSYVGIYCYG